MTPVRGLRSVPCAMLMIVAAVDVAACTGVAARRVIPAPSGFTATPKPSNCHVDFFWMTPDRPYKELAAVAVAPGSGRGNDTDLLEGLRAKACELGGDAIVVTHPFTPNEGIVVKYRDITNSER